MNTKNFVGKLNMITIKMMGKEFILSLMCFNDIIQTYSDHSLLFSKEIFFQVQYVQNYVKRFMKISVCNDCKYFPPLKNKKQQQQQYAIFYKLDLNKETYVELQFANNKNCKDITTHFLFNPFLHKCCTDASEVANLQSRLD
jgi:hypothetical protein